jgi:glycosyltransferase involved in cell wall biosynthesis
MKPTITLCMIVKDETHVIERCLRSAAPFVDRYDITDTGSTDGTPEKIKEIMDELGVPGEVYLSDWKGFGDHAGKIGSRTESFRNADDKADYAWVIDADDSLVGELILPDDADADAYSLKIQRGDFVWWRNQIFKTSSRWRYEGILHEYAACDNTDAKVTRLYGNYSVEARTEGNRNVGITATEKYSRDAEVLEKALEDVPDNPRYQFYLAQSYFDSQQWEKSLEAYQKRVDIGGWPEEVFYSMYRVAILKGIMEHGEMDVIRAFEECYNFKPDRAEPLYQISRIYRSMGKNALAFMHANTGLGIPYPSDDILFIQEEIYKYGLLDEIGATAFYAGKPHMGYAACKKLLEENIIPDEQRERVRQNYESYVNIMNQMQQQQMMRDMDSQINDLKKKTIQREQSPVKKYKSRKKKR